MLISRRMNCNIDTLLEPAREIGELANRTRVRAAGEGTIYFNEKRNRWEGQFPYTDPATGKTKRKLAVGKSQTEVSSKGKEFTKRFGRRAPP